MIEVSVHYPTQRLVSDPAHETVKIELALPKRPFLFWAPVRHSEMLPYPKGYGMAYFDFTGDRVLFAPMPLNVVIGGLIWIWHWVRADFAYKCYRYMPKRKEEINESSNMSSM